MARLLLTGATGLLGAGVIRRRPAGWDILAVQRGDGAGIADLAGVATARCDVTDMDAVRRLLDTGGFDAVLHGAGEGRVDIVEQDPAAARPGLVAAPALLARETAARGLRFVHISTNAVFGGDLPPYGEEDAPDPVNAYGRLKAEADRAVLEENPEAAILRPILMFGWPPPGARANPVTMVIDALRAGRRLRLVDDVRENPVLNLQVGDVAWALLGGRTSGIVHVAGATRIDRHGLGQMVAERFELDASLIDRVGSDAFPALARRPAETTFRTTRMEDELGVQPLRLEDALDLMRATDPD
jgi:dTDP-4-dehydrorhamnose reductase